MGVILRALHRLSTYNRYRVKGIGKLGLMKVLFDKPTAVYYEQGERYVYHVTNLLHRSRA